MPDVSRSTGPPQQTRGTGSFGSGVSVAIGVLRIILSPIAKPLAIAAGLMRARNFRQDVLREMSLTVTNLRPEVVLGATDRRGWYTEIYLNFRDFRVRITRAIYNRRRRDFWADIGSIADPAAFFRLDYMMEALRRLDKSGGIPELVGSPDTLAELDATIWAVHTNLAEHLSAPKYADTRRIVQKVMHDSTLAQGE